MVNVMQMMIVLEFAVANDFVIGNTFFVKRDSQLITYQSGNAKPQIDFILLRNRNLKMANTKRGMCPTAQTSDL